MQVEKTKERLKGRGRVSTTFVLQQIAKLNGIPSGLKKSEAEMDIELWLPELQCFAHKAVKSSGKIWPQLWSFNNILYFLIIFRSNRLLHWCFVRQSKHKGRGICLPFICSPPLSRAQQECKSYLAVLLRIKNTVFSRYLGRMTSRRGLISILENKYYQTFNDHRVGKGQT